MKKAQQHYESAAFPDGTVIVSRVEAQPTSSTQMILIEDGGHTLVTMFPANSDDEAITRTIALHERIEQAVGRAPRSGWGR